MTGLLFQARSSENDRLQNFNGFSGFYLLFYNQIFVQVQHVVGFFYKTPDARKPLLATCTLSR